MARCRFLPSVRALVAFLAVACLASVSMAQCARCGRFHAQQATSVSQPASSPQITVTTTVSVAQEKAHRLAALGKLTHAGRLAGRYEGVGFSTRSPDDAIRSCCYWGKRSPVDIGVARGARGWFAVVGYQ